MNHAMYLTEYFNSFYIEHEVRLGRPYQKSFSKWLADCLKPTQQAKHMQIRGMWSCRHNKWSTVIRWKGKLFHLSSVITRRVFFHSCQWHIRKNFAHVHYGVMIRFKRFFFLLLLGKKPITTHCEVYQASNGASTEYCSSACTHHCNAYKHVWAGLMQVWNLCRSKDKFRSWKVTTRIWSWSVPTGI